MGFGFAILVALCIIMGGLERLGNDIATCIFSTFPPNAILNSNPFILRSEVCTNKLYGYPIYPQLEVQMTLKMGRFPTHLGPFQTLSELT